MLRNLTRTFAARGAIFGLFFSMLVSSCSHQRATSVNTDSIKGTVQITHDASAASAPTVQQNSDDLVVDAPPGTTVTTTEYLPSVPAVEAKKTTMSFPQDKGGKITIKKSQFKASGSAGHEPPPPPSPFEKSLGMWSWLGALVFLAGIFFCTPWGGSHYRVGALISAGGLTMTLLGLFLNELSQWAKYKMPPWLPAVGFLGVAAALVLYYGYRLRHKQAESEAATK